MLVYLKPYYKKMGLGFIIKTLGTLSELMLPLILSHVLKNVIGGTIADVVLWGALMVVFAGLACILNILANQIAARTSSSFAETLRKDLFSKTLHLSAAQTDKFTIPSLESRITTDTYNMHRFVAMSQRMGIRAPIMLLGGITITLLMDAALSSIMIAILPVTFCAIFFISKNGIPLYSKVQASVDKMVRVVREDVLGIRVIKALSKTDYEHRRYDGVNHALVKSETRAGVIMGSVHPIMTLFMNAGSVAVIAVAGGRVQNGLSNPETIIAFMQYFTQISMSLMAVTRMFTVYTKCAASAQRVEEVLLSDSEITVASKQDFPDKPSDASIVFDNVSFSYNGKKNNVNHLSFSVPKGGSLGIIGATGSGKSTIIKLLLRFYDIDEGAIYIGSEDIRTIEKERFYAMFGTAQQHDFLYADTIAENIRFGRDISDEAMQTATKIAQADEFIHNLKAGYEHELAQHATNISGGQKQRLLISRALAGNPQILILDDSSSALDYKTDANLRRALAEHMQDITLITVAQRVSSVKDCSVIIVMDEGNIIGLGTHEKLLETCAEYKEISDSQMGGAFVE